METSIVALLSTSYFLCVDLGVLLFSAKRGILHCPTPTSTAVLEKFP